MAPGVAKAVDDMTIMISRVDRQLKASLREMEKTGNEIHHEMEALISKKKNELALFLRDAFSAQGLSLDENKSPVKKKKKTDKNPTHSSSLLASDVMSMKIVELRQECNRRNLEKTGNKKDLQQRLLEALEKKESTPESPKQDEEDKGGGADGPDNEASQEEKESRMSVEVSTGAPTDMMIIDKQEDVNGVSKLDASQTTQHDAMAVDEELDFTVPVHPAVGASKPAPQPSCDNKDAVASSSPKRRSRSPLKRVQSAFSKAFRPKPSPARHPNDFALLRDEEAENAPLLHTASAEDMEKAQQFSQFTHNQSTDDTSLRTIQPAATKDRSRAQPTNVRLQGASNAPNHSATDHLSAVTKQKACNQILLSKTCSLSSSSTSSSVKTDELEAKKRAQQLAKMRSMSKPVAKPANVLPDPSVKPLMSTCSSNKKTGKAARLAEQMREKNRLEKQENGLPASSNRLAAASSKSKNPIVNKPLDLETPALGQAVRANASSLQLKQSQHRQMQPQRQPPSPTSPLDTYEMSDHDDSDYDSDEEADQKRKKRIPSWAHPHNLNKALVAQFHMHNQHHRLDPDEIFGEVVTCDLEVIFGRKKDRYQRRTSSGNWANDHATAAEKLTYKRTMKYNSTNENNAGSMAH